MSESLLIPHIHCERKFDFSCTTAVPLSRMYNKKDFGVKKTAVFVPFCIVIELLLLVCTKRFGLTT